ncbi:MAG TPA: oligosaccharide flippase family protein, partial [Phycisphaerae bacterium]|nr:oligosaccharide flippase family protein [Phycisphaerae bacterium]
MSGLDRLLKVGSIAGSLGVYIPAVAAQKAMGLLRVLIFTYFLSKVEFGLWGLGMMIFNIAALVVTLGSNNGLVRYVSHYEARGRLQTFYRRARWVILGLGLILTGIGLLGSES